MLFSLVVCIQNCETKQMLILNLSRFVQLTFFLLLTLLYLS